MTKHKVCLANAIRFIESGLRVPLPRWTLGFEISSHWEGGAPQSLKQSCVETKTFISQNVFPWFMTTFFLMSKPQTSDTYGFGSHAQTMTLSTAVTFEDFLIYTGTPSWENDCVYVIPITENHKSFHQLYNKKSHVWLIAHSTLSIIQFDCFCLIYIIN